MAHKSRFSLIAIAAGCLASCATVPPPSKFVGARWSGQQGFAEGGDPQQQRDPLGRNAGTTGRTGTDEGLLQGEDVYRRADELLGELRKRSGEAERPQVERDYLDRLLERF